MRSKMPCQLSGGRLLNPWSQSIFEVVPTHSVWHFSPYSTLFHVDLVSHGSLSSPHFRLVLGSNINCHTPWAGTSQKITYSNITLVQVRLTPEFSIWLLPKKCYLLIHSSEYYIHENPGFIHKHLLMQSS